jgi:hypothetical protein
VEVRDFDSLASSLLYVIPILGVFELKQHNQVINFQIAELNWQAR